MGDSNNVLFEITEKHLNTGLRGFPVGTVRTSAVNPQTGVSYVGYPLADLADLDPESVIYLLYHKELPTAEQAADFKADLARRSVVDPAILEQVTQMTNLKLGCAKAGQVALCIQFKTEACSPPTPTKTSKRAPTI